MLTTGELLWPHQPGHLSTYRRISLDCSFSVAAPIAQLTVPAAGVLRNDSDPDDDSLTARLAGQAKQGAVNLQPDGSFTYTPDRKATGSDSFTYLAQDSSGRSDLGTVSIQITGAKKKKRRRHKK